MFLALSSQDSLLVFGGVAMKGEELINFVVLGVHDNDHQCSVASIEFFFRSAIEFTTLAAHAQGGTLFSIEITGDY